MGRGLLLALVAWSAWGCGRTQPYWSDPPSTPPNGSGCSDGTREGFVDLARYPAIAGCSAGFSVPGVGVTAEPALACGRVSGNDSTTPSGQGCSIADACAEGWHVCASASEVASKSVDGCTSVPATPALFFATRQSGTGCTQCATGSSTDPSHCWDNSCQSGCAQTALTTNDVFGCGSVGHTPSETCAPLNQFSDDLCGGLPPPWNCGSDSVNEANNVTKQGSDVGGALCCRD